MKYFLFCVLFFIPLELKTNPGFLEIFYGCDYSIDDAKNVIRHSEGLKLKAYKCIGQISKDSLNGHSNQYTIGYGQLIQGDSNTCISFSQAENMLTKHLLKIQDLFAEDTINNNAKLGLILLVYGIGYGNYKKSVIYKKLTSNQEVTKEDFTKWSRVNGKFISHLAKRHEKEYDIFSTKKKNSFIIKF